MAVRIIKHSMETIHLLTDAKSTRSSSTLSSTGFAFVYFEDERDGDDAMRALGGYPFGPGRCRLSLEWSWGDHGTVTHDHGRPASPAYGSYDISRSPVCDRYPRNSMLMKIEDTWSPTQQEVSGYYTQSL